MKKKSDEYLDISEETIFQMDEIYKQGFLENEEEIEMKKIRNEWKNQFDEIKNKFNEFS